MPHPSYDLDGDGIVSAKDYFLAKRFDADQDGRLNTREKETALRALESGYENQFVWKVEETGAHRGKRLLQVRGKFVDAEDFVPVASTYPRHPLSDVRAGVQTAAELREMRKAEVIANYKKTKDEWDKANPSSVPQQYILSEFLADTPKYYPMANSSQARIRATAEGGRADKGKEGMRIGRENVGHQGCVQRPYDFI